MDRSKSLVMIWMWIGIGIAIFGVSIYGAETGADITPLVLVPMVMAFVATVLLTLVPTERQQPAAEPHARPSKKERTRVDAPSRCRAIQRCWLPVLQGWLMCLLLRAPLVR